jgi:hypothetical protein
MNLHILPSRRAFGTSVSLLAAGWLLAGCATRNEPRYQELGEDFQVTEPAPGAARAENVFLQSDVLPRNVRRVAVLPLSSEGRRPELVDACKVLDPVFQAELTRTRKFEVVPASPDVLRIRTGRAEWTGGEVLPPKFFESLSEVYGADAVMFCQLTVFQPNPPLRVGWRLKLVDARTRQTLWAGDEVFDAGKPEQHASLWGRLRDEFRIAPDNVEAWKAQNSPRVFGQYTAAMLLGTLPNR